MKETMILFQLHFQLLKKHNTLIPFSHLRRDIIEITIIYFDMFYVYFDIFIICLYFSMFSVLVLRNANYINLFSIYL